MSHSRSIRIARARLIAGALAVPLAFAVAGPVAAQAENMTFFITSTGPGDGAALGGLDGADAHCQYLAGEAGVGELTWRAYLSTQAAGGQPAVNARDRIGDGPWHNYTGDPIAADVGELHSEEANLTKESILTENGDMVNGRGDDPNMHDILTGATLEGTAYPAGEDTTCDNWTSSASDGSARVGHHDRQGGGENPTSWNSAHGSRGCSQTDLQGTGGNGYFYCFAIDGSDEGEGGGARREPRR